MDSNEIHKCVLTNDLAIYDSWTLILDIIFHNKGFITMSLHQVCKLNYLCDNQDIYPNIFGVYRYANRYIWHALD